MVGMMEAKTSGIVGARDANGPYVGSYAPHSNGNRNAQGRAIGTGNLVASLIRWISPIVPTRERRILKSGCLWRRCQYRG